MNMLKRGNDIENKNNIDVQEQATQRGMAGAQTLIRGLEVLTSVSKRCRGLNEISDDLGLSRTTVHRLASALVDLRFLNFTPKRGYSLGPKVLELGHLASFQMSLARIAHDHLLELSSLTGDTVHLGILDTGRVLYLDKVQGSRRVEVSSRIGERQPLRSTGLGKALLLDQTEVELRLIYRSEAAMYPAYSIAEQSWLEQMKIYQAGGFTRDIEENEDRIRCVAAPIREAGGTIIGSISVSSAAQYMDDDRLDDLTDQVMKTAATISEEYGWNG